jgi:flagellar hook-basal body complex protein FliE
MPIDPIAGVDPISLTQFGQIAKTNQSTSAINNFSQILNKAINDLSQKENTANQAIASLAAGEDIDLHQVMLAMEEADISLQLALKVRNKLVEAYQDIMRMQV